MSNTYFWDFGFDFTAVQDPPSTGTSYLENGFVLINGLNNRNVPATPVNLSIGDVIFFNAFNTTNGLQQGDTYSIISGSIDFSSAETNQGTASPFNIPGTSTPQATISMTPTVEPPGSSIIFSGVQVPDAQNTNQPVFPCWNVAGPLTVGNNGRFLMNVSMVVQGPPGAQGQINQRTFVVDPEMVVGSIG